MRQSSEFSVREAARIAVEYDRDQARSAKARFDNARRRAEALHLIAIDEETDEAWAAYSNAERASRGCEAELDQAENRLVQSESIELPACSCGWNGRVQPGARGQRCPVCGESLC